MIKVSVKDIAEIVGGEVDGDADSIITGIGKIEEAGNGNITFLANPVYEKYIYQSQASAVIVDRSFSPQMEIVPALIKVDDVYGTLGKLLAHFNPDDRPANHIASSAELHPSITRGEHLYVGAGSVIEDEVVIGDNVKIMPQVYIGKHVKIGDNVTLHPGVKVYRDCVIGNNVVIHANTVVGSDGFGFSKNSRGEYEKIPQVGNVIIEDDVEIGSNVSIDRATMGSTRIGAGVKLDNLIQVGHNVVIGKGTVIAAQTGIAGSAKVGKDCLIGGQVGIVGHIEVADGTMIQAQSGVAKAVKGPNTKLYGSPAIDYSNYLRSYAAFKNLPQLIKDVNALKNDLEHLYYNQNDNEEENN